MGEQDIPVTTINECHFGARAHEDLGASEGLRSMWIEIPDYCHLQCGYCFADTERQNPHKCPQRLAETDYLKLLDDFRKAGGLYLGIPGNGEPFHPCNRELVMSLLRHATDIGLSTTVFTTADSIFYTLSGKDYETAVGHPLDNSLACELLTLNVILLVKFNSEQSAVQDKLVGQPGYTDARKRAMDALIGLGFAKERRLGIVTSILPENKDEIYGLFGYAQKNNLIFDCDTILPRGRGCAWNEKHPVATGEYKAIYDKVNRMCGHPTVSGGSYVGPACDRVRHHLYVDVTGNVYPCIGCVGKDPGFCLGNIRKMPIDDIWNHRLRVLLRDDLGGTLKGRCTWCENFQKTCWSCLGRQVVRCDITADSAALETKGCFNHRPKMDQWMAACNREIRRLILRVGLPGYQKLRYDFLAEMRRYGIETLWSSGGLGNDAVGRVDKDVRFSHIRLFGADVWKRILPNDPHEVLVSDDASEAIMDDDREHLARLKSLLPRFFLPTLSLLADRYDKPLGHSFTGDTVAPGLFQFCLLMFYMPERKRYFYRSVAFNSFDPGSVDRDDVRLSLENAPVSGQDIRSRCESNNRRVRLVQRWAESLRDGEDAQILPHIRNFSRDMEADHVNTYELVLGTDLFAEQAVEIDSESRHYPRRRILGVGELLDTPAIRSRVRRLADAVERVVGDDQRWRTIDAFLSSRVFAWDDAVVAEPLREVYKDFAKESFYNPADMADEEKETLWRDIQCAVTDILCRQVWMFPTGSEADWFSPDLRASLDDFNWGHLLKLTHSDRRKSLLEMLLPPAFDMGQMNDKTRKGCIVDRLYNRLLVEFVRLFRSDNGERHPEWLKAVNYFIWLGYYRDVLGVRDYFVLHAPNLQQHCSVLFQDQIPLLPASGMILSSTNRLPFRMREECEELFRTIISPVEELSFANVSSDSGKKVGQQQIELALSHELDSPLGIISSDKEKLSPQGRLAVCYLEMWRRFTKRQWSDALPVEMEALFDSNEALFATAFNFGWWRASRRGKIPMRLANGRLRKWESEELLREIDKWLDVSLAFPIGMLACKGAWAFQVKMWLLFLLIGACYHVIQYSLGQTKNLDSWDTAKNFRRGNLELFAREVSEYKLEIVIRNSGDKSTETASYLDDVVKAITSHDLGLIRLPAEEYAEDCKVKFVEVRPHECISASPGQPAVWEAVITVHIRDAEKKGKV